MGAFRDRVRSEVKSYGVPAFIEITGDDRKESQKANGSKAQTDWLLGEARLACAGMPRVLVVFDGEDRLKISAYTPDELR